MTGQGGKKQTESQNLTGALQALLYASKDAYMMRI